MININAVLDPTTGDLFGLYQQMKTPDTKLCKDVALNRLSRLSQGIKKRTIKGTNTIHFILPDQKPTNKKASYAQMFVS